MNARKNKVAHSVDRYPDSRKTLDITTEFVAYMKFLRVFGFAPLSFARMPDGRWIVNQTMTLCVYSWIFTSIVVGLPVYTLYMEIRLGKIDTTADQLVKFMEISAMSGCILSASLTMRTRIAKLLEYLAVISQIHDNFGTKEYRKLTDRRLLLVILFTTIAGLLVDSQEVYDDTVRYGFFEFQAILLTVPYSILYHLCFVLKGKFSFLMWNIEIRTSAMLGEIEQLINKDIHSCREPERLVDRLQELQERQGRLRFCSNNINDGFGLPLLLFLVFIMLEVIIPVYYFIFYLTADDGLRAVFVNLQWIIYLTWWTLLMVEPCHQYVKKDELISYKIGEMILKMGGSKLFERDWREASKIKLFWSKQMLLLGTPAGITAFSVMAVNREILASFTGAITTFLVILLQLNEGQ